MKPIRKIWVVTLTGGSQRKPKRDSLIVRAATKELAVITAKNYSIVFRNGKCRGSATEADPQLTLGAKTKAQVLAQYAEMRGQRP